MDKIIQLAKKLKALSDRGVDGEKENATAFLQRLMRKHNITLDMIEGEKISDHRFKMKPEKVIFFGQVVASVLGKKDIYLLRNEKGKLKTRILACTDSEAIEIWAKFEFFYKAWEADMKVFYSAFVQKNHLYQKPDASEDEEDEEEDTPLTPQERAKLYKMASMMEGIDRHHYTKQLK